MNFLIVGLTRDSARSIRSEVFRLRDVFSPVGATEIFLVESDSSDHTVEMLTQIADQHSWFRFVSLGSLSDSLSERTERLAHCRNRYVQEIIQRNLAATDRVVIADFDGINTRLTTESVQEALLLSDWDVITANQDGPYYDMWTLRHELLSPNDYREVLNLYTSFGIPFIIGACRALYSRMVRIPMSIEPVEVESAFGGLAIYRPWVFSVGEYRGLTSNGEPIGEHVVFNQQIRLAGARICIAPKLINAGRTEHSSVFRLMISLVKRRLIRGSNR